jgi:biotin operon repressor
MSRAETVDAEDFVRAWQTCDSVADVADRLRMSKVGASVKASHLRRAGVPLKKYRTGIGSDPAGFIEIWNASVSLEEAAVKLGIQKTSASMRAAILRKNGYQVKRFQRGRKRIVDTLTEIARQYAPET